MAIQITPQAILSLIKTPDKKEGYENFRQLVDVMESHHIDSLPSLAGAAATIAVETAHTFMPISEYGNAAYFKKTYGTRPDYEVDEHGLWKWRGRGFIQLTGKANYQTCGKQINLPLAHDPDMALEMPEACEIFVWYWERKGLSVLCDVAYEHDSEVAWKNIRYVVNGGLNGWDSFRAALVALNVLPQNSSLGVARNQTGQSSQHQQQIPAPSPLPTSKISTPSPSPLVHDDSHQVSLTG